MPINKGRMAGGQISIEPEGDACQLDYPTDCDYLAHALFLSSRSRIHLASIIDSNARSQSPTAYEVPKSPAQEGSPSAC